MNILLVEDEVNLSRALKRILEQKGYYVDAVYDGLSALDYARGMDYQLLILDGMLPGLDGVEVLRTLRREGHSTPILMLTARSAVADKVTGLNAGADDYLTKPFDTEELLARVGALTRRTGEVVVDTASFGDLALDVHTGLLSCGEGSVQLSKKELEVMKAFLFQPGAPVSKEALLLRAWGGDTEATENSVEVYISFLRKKLKFLKSRVGIRTIPRIGYLLEEEAC
ncbi:MAG: response regulator transcription factor [Oscillospiraceae bacterium]|nr:response regulator transcription factor [Oscillospiraceae bacterium]